jgi:hypothetical protein
VVSFTLWRWVDAAAIVLLVIVLGWAWEVTDTSRTQTEHCNKSLAGVAVKSAGGGVVCMRADSVLKVYDAAHEKGNR